MIKNKKKIIFKKINIKLKTNTSTDNYIKIDDYKVAIIMTCYNTQDYIYESIYSILNQTHTNFNLFIVDDFSTDNTVSIINKFTDDRIIFIQNTKNEGTYYCKNLALKKIEQDINKYNYIAFQDSDDVSSLDRIEIQIKKLIEKKVLMTSVISFRDNKNKFSPITILFDITVFENLGYFDINRFGSDSEFLYRFSKFYNLKKKNNLPKSDYIYQYNYDNYYYLIKKKLYFVNNRPNSITYNIPLFSEKRLEHKKSYILKIDNFKNHEEFKYSFDL